MGASSANLFGSDIACTVRADYGQYLRWGMSGRAATKQILDDWADELSDVTQDAPVVWLALAVTQSKYGRLEPRVKAKALKIVKDGGDLTAFPPELQRRRSKELDRIRLQLEGPQPPEKQVRVTKPPEPLKSIENHWTPGQVVAFRRDAGQLVLLVTEGVMVHDFIGQIPYFLALDWEGATLPSADRIRELPAIEFALCAYPNQKGEPIPWERIERLDVTRELSGYIRVTPSGAFCKTGLHSFRWREFDAFLAENLKSLLKFR